MSLDIRHTYLFGKVKLALNSLIAFGLNIKMLPFFRQKLTMAATASAPPPAPVKKTKAEIQFTGELDEILKRITEIKNIAGVIVVNSEGITVKSTLENSLSVQVNKKICENL